MTARARREVIVSAGADWLAPAPDVERHRRAGASARARDRRACTSFRGSGQNLHDHLFVPITYRAPSSGHRGSPGHFFAGMLKELALQKLRTRGHVVRQDRVRGGRVPQELATTSRSPISRSTRSPGATRIRTRTAPIARTSTTDICFTVMPTLIYPKEPRRGAPALERPRGEGDLRPALSRASQTIWRC